MRWFKLKRSKDYISGSNSLFDQGFYYIDEVGLVKLDWLTPVINSLSHVLCDDQYTFLDQALIEDCKRFVAKALAFSQFKGYPKKAVNNLLFNTKFSAIFNDSNCEDGLNKLTKSRFEVLFHYRVDYLNKITAKKPTEIHANTKSCVYWLLCVSILFESIKFVIGSHEIWKKTSPEVSYISIFYHMMSPKLIDYCMHWASDYLFILLDHLMGHSNVFEQIICDINQKIESVIIEKYPQFETLKVSVTQSTNLGQEKVETLNKCVNFSYFTKDSLIKYVLKNLSDCNLKGLIFYDVEKAIDTIFLSENCFYQFALTHKENIQSIDQLVRYLTQEKIISESTYKIKFPDGGSKVLYALTLNEIPDVINDCPGEIWLCETKETMT